MFYKLIKNKNKQNPKIYHGNPSPKNTFTALDPVTFPIAASAVSSLMAADLDANVSGREVPRATNYLARTDASTIA